MHVEEQDEYDLNKLYEVLEKEILPLYYDNPEGWRALVQKGMKDVIGFFESNRMAKEYYDLMYKS